MVDEWLFQSRWDTLLVPCVPPVANRIRAGVSSVSTLTQSASRLILFRLLGSTRHSPLTLAAHHRRSVSQKPVFTRAAKIPLHPDYLPPLFPFNSLYDYFLVGIENTLISSSSFLLTVNSSALVAPRITSPSKRIFIPSASRWITVHPGASSFVYWAPQSTLTQEIRNDAAKERDKISCSC
jgi:hypothetical protein